MSGTALGVVSEAAREVVTESAQTRITFSGRFPGSTGGPPRNVGGAWSGRGRSPGSPSGLGGFWFAAVETPFEQPPELLAGEPRTVSRAARFQLQDPHRLGRRAVAAGVALRLAERPKPTHHGRDATPPSGRCTPALEAGTVSAMGSPRAKVFHYAIAQDRGGMLTADGHAELDLDREWTPEHLVLAGLVRCTLESLRFHADRVGIDFVAGATASATVTRRDDDGRYAFVEIECRFDVEVQPLPAAADLAELLESAERDCFVGASLTSKPAYRWRVNGSDV
jgi:uncharacterized OsmC-like protein